MVFSLLLFVFWTSSNGRDVVDALDVKIVASAPALVVHTFFSGAFCLKYIRVGCWDGT
jgi:hypothetical protein